MEILTFFHLPFCTIGLEGNGFLEVKFVTTEAKGKQR